MFDRVLNTLIIRFLDRLMLAINIPLLNVRNIVKQLSYCVDINLTAPWKRQYLDRHLMEPKRNLAFSTF